MTKLDESLFVEMKQTQFAMIQKQTVRIENINNKIESTDNYIARYLPFNNFCQIIESVKVVNSQLSRDAQLRERVDNYEKYKMKELYQGILFDDGRAPRQFTKTNLVIER